MNFLNGESVTFLTNTVSGQDDRGNDVYSSVPLVVADCGFDPGGSVENAVGGDQVVSQPTVYAPAGTVLTAVDQCVARGVTYDVDGQPSAPLNPFTGWQPGVVVKLKGVTG